MLTRGTDVNCWLDRVPQAAATASGVELGQGGEASASESSPLVMHQAAFARLFKIPSMTSVIVAMSQQ